MKLRNVIAGFALMVLASSVFGVSDEGLAAYNRGDYKTALAEWRPLAEQGNVFAQYNLGNMYSRGQGVPQNYIEAVKWYRLAAEQGLIEAQFNLGVRYGIGQGVPQDYKEAMKWYRVAAEQGLANAQFSLGYMYDEGKRPANTSSRSHL